MKDRVTALLVHQNSDTLRVLKGALERQGIGVIQAESRVQAKRMLSGLNPPPLVFTDVQLPDGSWADIVAMAEKAAQPVNVIVVARVVDTRFYVEAIETGAFDFIAPPFAATDLAHVVRCAMDNVLSQRSARRRTGPDNEEHLLSEVPAARTPLTS
jgi:two-component system nitrogen regulation response regulator GlnG